MRKYRPPVIDIIRPFFGAIIGIALVGAVMGYKLGTIGPGVSPAEASVVQTIQSRSLGVREILLENPLYLPHQVGVYGLEKLGLTSLAAIRSVGAVFGVLATISMYLILKHWHTQRVAILGTLLFATSSWLLHSARLAVPEVSYLLLPILVFLGIKLEEGKHPFFTVSAALFVGASLLYVPGLVWFIVPAALWQRKRILERFGDVNKLTVSIVSLLAFVLLAPLAYTLITNSSLWQQWLGFNGQFTEIKEILKNAARLPLHIFVQNEANPLLTVGRLPLLDLATSALVMLGAYWYLFQRKLDRAKLIVGGLGLGTALVAVNGVMLLAILLPFIYILAAAGVTLMLQQWFTVFPRNPLARGIGIGLITLVIGLIGFYHLQRYFIAWPNTPETKAVFSTDI